MSLRVCSFSLLSISERKSVVAVVGVSTAKAAGATVCSGMPSATLSVKQKSRPPKRMPTSRARNNQARIISIPAPKHVQRRGSGHGAIWRSRPCPRSRLNGHQQLVHHVDVFADGLGRLGECRPLLGGQLQLHDALDPLAPEDRRQADEEIFDAVLPLAVNRAGQEAV